jgi:hypothetical protein
MTKVPDIGLFNGKFGLLSNIIPQWFYFIHQNPKVFAMAFISVFTGS